MYEHHLLKFFKYEHLPVFLQTASKPFGDLARSISTEAANLKDPAELDACLRKLLEAKDCAVRILLP